MKSYDLRTIGLALLLAAIAGSAHGFEIDQFVIAGGGAMATSGGGLELSGTIGQQDAGGTKTAGSFASASGFWVDACPGDTSKLEPGACGCGVEDSDPCIEECTCCCPGAASVMPVMFAGMWLMRRHLSGRHKLRRSIVG